jgi:hypothetical protein
MVSPLVIVFLGIFVGLVKGGITGPIGGAVLLPLLVSQGLSVPEAAGVVLPLLIVGDMFALRFYWREWDWKLVRRLLPAAVVGIGVGVWLLVSLDDSILRPILGVLTIVAVVYKILSDSLKQMAYSPRAWHAYLAGFTTGVTSAIANVGGPPMSAFLLLQKLEPLAYVGTMTLFFAIVNLVKLPLFFQNNIIDTQILLSVAWAVPLIPVGVWIGRWAIGKINRLWFERAMIVLVLAASLLLIFKT